MQFENAKINRGQQPRGLDHMSRGRHNRMRRNFLKYSWTYLLGMDLSTDCRIKTTSSSLQWKNGLKIVPRRVLSSK